MTRRSFLLACAVVGALVIRDPLKWVPAEWIVEFHLTVVPLSADTAPTVIIQTRTRPAAELIEWLTFGAIRTLQRDFRAEWEAQVKQIVPDGAIREVCSGDGAAVYRWPAFVYRPSLDEWTDDPRCAALPHGTYYAIASWTFDWLGRTKTTVARSEIWTQ